MASKLKTLTEQVVHGPIMKTHIPAAKASAAPPLGPMLGQRGINIAIFCKEFNEKTQNIKDGLPLQTHTEINVSGLWTFVSKRCDPPSHPHLVLLKCVLEIECGFFIDFDGLKPDRSYSIKVFKPPIPFLVKQAAGVRRSSMKAPSEISGIITLKHVYEIAKFKHTDESHAHLTLEQLCTRVIHFAKQSGIKVIRENLDAQEYSDFLLKRKTIEDLQIKELTEKRMAKLMRSTSAATQTTTAKK